jgi:hypothetical protein
MKTDAEQGARMSWADALKSRAAVALSERPAPDRPLSNQSQPPGWNPHEVWLTRIHLPRVRQTRDPAPAFELHGTPISARQGSAFLG